MSLPPKQGLYDPRNEHDSCGVGFVVHFKGQKSHEIVRQGIQILLNLEHRGAVGADPLAGDGAGLLLQTPDDLLREELARPADRISVSDVVKACEHGQPLAECFDVANNACVITPACRLKGMLAEAMRAFHAALGQYTIADACERPDALRRHLGLMSA